jgi:hypothetical protein
VLWTTPLFGSKQGSVAICSFCVGSVGCRLVGFLSVHIRRFPATKHHQLLFIRYFIRMERFGFGQLSGLGCFDVRDVESGHLLILFSLCETPSADSVDLQSRTPNTALASNGYCPLSFRLRYET